jgi:CHAT domain-containing protein/tetratricopeptide (TPR) repeat protein
MGKAARNRKRRQERIASQREKRADDQIVAHLFHLADAAEFARLTDEHPELLNESTAQQLDEHGESPKVGRAFTLAAQLLRAARNDPATAWIAFRKQMDDLDALLEEIGTAIDGLSSMRDEGRHDEALVICDAALAHARAANHGQMIAEALVARAHICLQRQAGSRADNIERAIAAFDEALERTMDPERAAHILMHLGIAHAERLRGDRRDNFERATEALREALSLLTDESDPDHQAIIQHNLATVLMRREAGERRDNLDEATELCRAALRVRSPERDAVDWAHTQLSLGAALEQLADLEDGTELDEAFTAYRSVIGEAVRIDAPWLVGAAHLAIGKMHLAAAAERNSAEANFAAHEAGTLNDLYDIEPHLTAARAELELARPLLRNAADPVYHGRVLAALTTTYAELGQDDEAVDAGRAALALLRPDTAPRACTEAAATLAGLLSVRGEWEEAANVYRVGLAAADQSLNSRLDLSSRQREIRNLGAMPRWAAFALARSGDLREAMLVLEAGRTRDLRRRIAVQAGASSVMDSLPADLRAEYEVAAAALAAVPLEDASVNESRRYQEALLRIRELRGLEDFGSDSGERDVVDACEVGWPLLYIAPTPSGTLLLLAVKNDGEVVHHARFLDDLRGIDIHMHLMTSGGATDGSYLLAVGSEGTSLGDDEFRANLDGTLPWLGERLGRPVRDLLVQVGAIGATLVACGPAAAAPLHAIPWSEGGSRRCLLDEFSVRFAPSATLAAAARRRAERLAQQVPTFVGLGDPESNLPAAGPEVEEIARLFAPGDAIVATQEEANTAFLRTHAQDARYLHLACHAKGGLFDRADAVIHLSDGPLSASDVTTYNMLATRLVVVSACESGLSEIAGLPDEVLSIGTAMVAAGTACAIASLWPVDDRAAALLMLRTYEEMIGHGLRPPEALRRAQLWLRDLTIDDERRFLAEHPTLEAEFRRLGERRVDAGSGKLTAAGALSDDRRFAHEDMWAAFVAVGV